MKKDNGVIGIITILFIIFIIWLSSTKLKQCNSDLQNQIQNIDSTKQSYIGKKIILNYDTLLIINSSSFGTEYTLEDNRVISEDLLKTLKIIE